MRRWVAASEGVSAVHSLEAAQLLDQAGRVTRRARSRADYVALMRWLAVAAVLTIVTIGVAWHTTRTHDSSQPQAYHGFALVWTLQAVLLVGEGVRRHGDVTVSPGPLSARLLWVASATAALALGALTFARRGSSGWWLGVAVVPGLIVVLIASAFGWLWLSSRRAPDRGPRAGVDDPIPTGVGFRVFLALLMATTATSRVPTMGLIAWLQALAIGLTWLLARPGFGLLAWTRDFGRRDLAALAAAMLLALAAVLVTSGNGSSIRLAACGVTAAAPMLGRAVVALRARADGAVR